ncbi:LppX_LprAFG lipoprotein [Sphaerisporangium sp. TRM90804]|uniref:LppX_LprAFG lipoprotein n=1 Tax=Sphaerisporangium sp. TRM90804 TaxID=3031113 RepID=UPI00244BBDE3|nr:LppX_LprAFG lipoprotein [Sphaerisporangium sp. TRM90804]MDH2428512.1 LppX_LprAFG lipoprotein [Sphaerisporangium sp. TRM90804]
MSNRSLTSWPPRVRVPGPGVMPFRGHRPGVPSPRLTGVVAGVAALLCLTGACMSTPEAAAKPPAGPELMVKSSQAMRQVETVAFTIATEGAPPVPVKSADGSLTKRGDAKGTIQISVLGALQELEFVVIGETVHFKGPTGGFQTIPRAQLATIYDPSAILNADKGVPKLLASAANPVTEAEEKVGGADAYRVAATLPKQSVTTLVPGVAQDVNAKLWVDKATGRLAKASLPLGTGATSGTVHVTFADYDAPVTITPPAR